MQQWWIKYDTTLLDSWRSAQRCNDKHCTATVGEEQHDAISGGNLYTTWCMLRCEIAVNSRRHAVSYKLLDNLLEDDEMWRVLWTVIFYDGCAGDDLERHEMIFAPISHLLSADPVRLGQMVRLCPRLLTKYEKTIENKLGCVGLNKL